jgi:hypothetical protein
MIFKPRSTTSEDNGWNVASNHINPTWESGLVLNTSGGLADGWFGILNNTAPTSTVFTVSDWNGVNQSGQTYVAYLFASCPGVSKVGSYTGNGSSQTINCGFTGGARFVMVKRINSTGNWLVVDTARGLVSAGDPTLYLNSTAAEVTGNDWIDPDSSGFIVNQTSTINANVNGGTYIFWAIA